MTTTSPIADSDLFAPPPQAKRNDELGQSDFLTLMITQFKNQDPFKPMENGEFLGQLAQFSTVSGIDSLNTAFAGLSSAIQGEQTLQAASLVGHKVLAVTDVGYLEPDGSINGAIELSSSASDVQVDILDETGELLQTMRLGQQSAGLVSFSWDGRTSAGDLVNPGHYRIEARVARGGQVEGSPVAIESTINSITLGQFGQGMRLNLNGGLSMPLAQVYQIVK
ncbi:MAG: flagellar hook assembly protein FlgD [Woeseiaceae bacterium]|nr:flagellar hook assembly protein FlgD [Woeseiaceae bacterium]